MSHVRAVESFLGVGRDGSQVTVQKDKIYRADHPAVMPTTAHFFEELDPAEGFVPAAKARRVTAEK